MRGVTLYHRLHNKQGVTSRNSHLLRERQLLQIAHIRADLGIRRELQLGSPTLLLERQILHHLSDTPCIKLGVVLRDVVVASIVDRPEAGGVKTSELGINTT